MCDINDMFTCSELKLCKGRYYSINRICYHFNEILKQLALADEEHTFNENKRQSVLR